MTGGVVAGFLLGAPFWFTLGVALMGRLCAMSRLEEGQSEGPELPRRWTVDLQGDEDTGSEG